MDPVQVQGIGVAAVLAIVEILKRLLVKWLPSDIVAPILSVILGVVYSLLTGQPATDGAGIGGFSAILFKILHYFTKARKTA